MTTSDGYILHMQRIPRKGAQHMHGLRSGLLGARCAAAQVAPACELHRCSGRGNGAIGARWLPFKSYDGAILVLLNFFFKLVGGGILVLWFFSSFCLLCAPAGSQGVALFMSHIRSLPFLAAPPQAPGTWRSSCTASSTPPWAGSPMVWAARPLAPGTLGTTCGWGTAGEGGQCLQASAVLLCAVLCRVSREQSMLERTAFLVLHSSPTL